MAVFIILIIMFLAGLLWVLRPLAQPPDPQALPRTPAGDEAGAESALAPRVIEQLIDLEYDLQTGKISEEEYRRQRAEILRQK